MCCALFWAEHRHTKRGQGAVVLPRIESFPSKSKFGQHRNLEKNLVLFINALLCDFIMAAQWNRAGHYIFALWFHLSFFFFSSPTLSGQKLDVYHTSTHGVALVRI